MSYRILVVRLHVVSSARAQVGPSNNVPASTPTLEGLELGWKVTVEELDVLKFLRLVIGGHGKGLLDLLDLQLEKALSRSPMSMIHICF